MSGLGYVPKEPGGNERIGLAAVGLGFKGKDAASTMIHELGHNHGRKHAPCGDATNYDDHYPYYRGSIGVWGYDLVEKKIKDPRYYTDFMGYCYPRWVSDYTYSGIFRWIQNTNAQPAYFAVPTAWRSLRIRSNGEVIVGDTVQISARPSGEPTRVELVDVDGNLVNAVTGYFTGYDHLPGGIVLFPDPGDEVTYARLEGTALIRL
jgi:hypothetical protein